MSPFGLDYAWAPHPTVAEHKAIGSVFAMRYLSHDPAKDLSAAEARELRSGGVDVGVVWETTASRALSGRSGGVADAKDADVKAKACGMPAGRPIYFGVDFDATTGQQAAINDYFRGVASVIGLGRTGVYAGYWPLKRLFDLKLIAYGWQTYAWSGGNLDSRAQLYQYSNGHKVGAQGADCDYNRSLKPDFGQWGFKPAPSPHTRGKGVAVAELRFDLATLAMTVTPKPAAEPITWEQGDPRWASQEIQLGLSGTIAGKWRHRSLPFNAAPLGD